jgi:hypothetical protein
LSLIFGIFYEKTLFFFAGNTQMIEVVQTAPGKFVTASGHAIKAAASPGGVKTIIRTAAGSPQVRYVRKRSNILYPSVNFYFILGLIFLYDFVRFREINLSRVAVALHNLLERPI